MVRSGKKSVKKYNMDPIWPPTVKRGRGRPPKFQQSASEAQAVYRTLEKMPDDAYISPNQAAAVLGITGEAVKQWIYNRRLPATKLPNGYWKVKVEDFREFIKSRLDASCRRILLADTNEASISRIKEILEGMGHKCIVAHNAVDAMLKTADIYPAIVIINLSANGIDGWKLAEKLRNTKVLKKTPILLFSSKEEDVDNALAVNAQGFLRYPFDKELFAKEVERVLKAVLA
jgi:excisionase family DNA binding protein